MSFACVLRRSVPFTFTAAMAMLMSGCGGSTTSPIYVNPLANSNPATMVYTLSISGNIEVYSTSFGSQSTPVGTLSLPSGFLPVTVTTDAAGQVYVEGVANSTNALSIFVYPAGSVGSASPARTLNLSTGNLTVLKVDASGYVYGLAPGANLNIPSKVYVFAPSANAGDGPARMMVISAIDQASDMAVANGTLYLAGQTTASSNQQTAVMTFAAGGNGQVSPTSTLAPAQTVQFIAVDSHGNIFASGSDTYGHGVLDEYAAGSTGTSAPARTFSFPSTTVPDYSSGQNVVLDRAGNLFASWVRLDSTSTQQESIIYSFGTASTFGSSTPAQLTLPNYAAVFTTN